MLDQAIRSRVLAALGAGAFSQVISLVIQLGSLPLFLMQWDTHRYGVWLMLSAIPAYLSMADVGLVTTAGNRMTMALAQGQVAIANRVFHTAQAFLLLVSAMVGLIVALVLFGGLSGLQPNEVWALWWLTLAVLLSLAGGIAEAAFRATERYAQGTTVANLIRLVEWLAALVGLWLSGDYAGVAFGMAMARLFGLFVLVQQCQADQHGLSWKVSGASLAEMRDMVKPALSFMAFPLANALTFQGATLLVGWVCGPAAVTAFNAARTVSRVAVQCTAIPAHALWAEFSRLYGLSNWTSLKQLYVRAFRSGLALSIGLSIVLYWIGPWLYQWWTARQLAFDANLMSMLLIYAAVAGVWHVPRVLLMSSNQHVGLAAWQVSSSVLMLACGYVLLKPYGLLGMAISMLLAEVLLAVVCTMQAKGKFRDQSWDGVVTP